MRGNDGEIPWMAWLAGSLSIFGVLEAIAYRTGRFPTLSATLARWLGTYPNERRGPLATLLFVAGWVLLTLHIVRYEPRVVAAAEQILLLDDSDFDED